ncbi:L-rhamnose isomerase [Salmonella enterica]|nr:L-rhamnose isomerase [Salmonella enterica]EDI6462946.1 L-rhamnose isomerase [Salmonella enterica subsp. enterica serovar Typhimurium]EAS8041723.1 L-rhamnose isomerase [Salmonella enterica]EBB7493806.1 L-rhamnose isomerase [Salmonella enterica]EBE1308963.1 L-rhamnose isomerase [Salmonella enterica]
MTFRHCVAVDLGASSGRVMLARYDSKHRTLTLREIHRFVNCLQKTDGFDTWDIDSLEKDIRLGLKKVCNEGILIDSIGIDTWGVDYVLLDKQGQRVGLPVSYRDNRTTGIMPQALVQIGKSEIYRRSGIQSTGNYPGKARNATELRADLEQALRLIPGPKRLNLHAIYLESDTPVARDQIKPEHFKNWVEWAKANRLGLDFNPTCFSHPLNADGFTLSHPDAKIRQFWIDHCKASRRVSAYFGEQLGTPSVMNIWIPDGMKDITVDRLAPRQRLLEALDEVISEKFDPAHHIDAVESKLFGIGAESYTVGSNEFYMGYATSRQTALCLDAGHFHPTEVISDKISAAMLYVPRLLLHVSRPVRWDSDHVVLLDDETQAIASEIVRHNLFDRVHIGLDFFDASINRVAAWVIGTRNMKKALLRALLEPTDQLRQLEASGDYTARLALLEEQKSLPWQAVWEMYCQRHDTPAGSQWLDSVRVYEKEILSKRS